MAGDAHREREHRDRIMGKIGGCGSMESGSGWARLVVWSPWKARPSIDDIGGCGGCGIVKWRKRLRAEI